MYPSEGVISRETLDLISEVKEHLARLAQEKPEEAAFLRQRLLELLQTQELGLPSAGARDEAFRQTQLLALRDWEEERARLADRLRAGPGQLLANAAVELTSCLPLLETDAELVRQGLKALEQELRSGLEELRRILSELEPPHLIRELGLLNSLQSYAQRIAEGTGISVETRFPARLPQFPPIVEVGIYRIIQEALRNATQHGQASVITLAVERRDDHWRFTVQDDGTGFEPTRLYQARGLVKMYEWANAFGGLLEVRSKPGHGTLVVLMVPWPHESKPSAGGTSSVMEEVGK